MNSKKFWNKTVQHKKFGTGIITGGDAEYITVNFSNEQKRFKFPDCFAKFLVMDDADLQKAALAKANELNRLKKEAEREETIRQIEQRSQRSKINKFYDGKSNGRNRRNGKKHRKARKQKHHRTAELTKDQKRALALLESGKNVFLSGEAGTGKSFVLNEFIFRNRDKNIIVCAPTGIAAINVGGSTLHRVFKAPFGVAGPGEYNTKPDNSVIEADIIVIDEISMCRFDLFEYVIRTIRMAEELRQQKENRKAIEAGRTPELCDQKQIIVVGDFYQLEPVIRRRDEAILFEHWDRGKYGEGFAFESDLWKALHFQSIVLKEIVRQKRNDEYITNLNKIRMGNYEGIDWFNANVSRQPIPDSIFLCGRNDTADKINRRESEALDGKPVVYHAEAEGKVNNSDKMTADELELKVGMQVMTLVNNDDEGYQNGSIGEVVSLRKDSVNVRLNTGRIVTVKQHDWEILGYEVQEEKVEKIVLGNFKQIPLKIAYAITIHKSQGQTYSSVNIAPECFANGQLYVALSRCQTLEGMCLMHDIHRQYLRTSSRVREFYEQLEESREEYELKEKTDEVVEVVPVEIINDLSIDDDFEVSDKMIDRGKSELRDRVLNMSEEEINSCTMYKSIYNNPNAYVPWTEDEEQIMLEELSQGMSVREIAKEHARTTGAIRSRIKKIRERK